MAQSKSVAKRTWLNPQASRTSFVSFTWSPAGQSGTLTISDCNRKVSIHDYIATAKQKRDFVKKLRKIEDHAKELADVIEDYDLPKEDDDWL